jgi:hypothetical protein
MLEKLAEAKNHQCVICYKNYFWIPNSYVLRDRTYGIPVVTEEEAEELCKWANEHRITEDDTYPIIKKNKLK